MHVVEFDKDDVSYVVVEPTRRGWPIRLALRKAGPKAPEVATAIVNYEQMPEASIEPVRHALVEARLDQNQDVIDRAVALLRDAEQVRPGVSGGLVGQINNDGGKVTVIGGN